MKKRDRQTKDSQSEPVVEAPPDPGTGLLHSVWRKEGRGGELGGGGVIAVQCHNYELFPTLVID